MFIADWLDVIFVHFRVDAARLARRVPLQLDLYEGEAYLSLVAFTQSRLRPTVGGRLGERIVAPLAHHEFLNVRTYVRHGDDRGIFFIAEWIPNRVAAFIGPRTYGLPYRLGRLNYDGMRREIAAEGKSLMIAARGIGASPVLFAAPAALPRSGSNRERMGGAPMPRGAFDEFLLERYTAFTHRNRLLRRFDVEHAPWPQRRIQVDVRNTGLLQLSGDWFADAEFVAAHHSHGVRDVRISGPRRVAGGELSAISDQ